VEIINEKQIISKKLKYILYFFKLNNENNQLIEIKISKSKLGFSKWTKINVQNQNMKITLEKNNSPYHKYF
jgi:hypothetical protein